MTYYETMSVWLNEIVAVSKAKAIKYEEYLKRITELARKVEGGQTKESL